MPVSGLENPCPTCGRISGDHTLREWAECLGTSSETDPFHELDADAAKKASKVLREQLGLDEDLIVADNVVIKAVAVGGASGVLDIRVPALVHEFAIGAGGGEPIPAAKVLFLGDVAAIRGYGRLVRDSANAAANRVEGNRK